MESKMVQLELDGLTYLILEYTKSVAFLPSL